jgi:hypothetical protein
MSLRHDCQKQGCYKDTCIPDWEIFDGCFDAKSHKIKVSDVDGVVEINGHILWLEWKRALSEISVGQKMLYQSFSSNSPKQIVLVVVGPLGCPERYCIFNGGKQMPWLPCTREILRERMKRWTQRAMTHGGKA